MCGRVHESEYNWDCQVKESRIRNGNLRNGQTIEWTTNLNLPAMWYCVGMICHNIGRCTDMCWCGFSCERWANRVFGIFDYIRYMDMVWRLRDVSRDYSAEALSWTYWTTTKNQWVKWFFFKSIKFAFITICDIDHIWTAVLRNEYWPNVLSGCLWFGISNHIDGKHGQIFLKNTDLKLQDAN